MRVPWGVVPRCEVEALMVGRARGRRKTRTGIATVGVAALPVSGSARHLPVSSRGFQRRRAMASRMQTLRYNRRRGAVIAEIICKRLMYGELTAK